MANAQDGVWFGTKAKMQWVPAPALNMNMAKQGYQGQANFTNGGMWVRRSKASAKMFSMSWNMRKEAEIRPVLDYADGMYGNDYVYFVNPFYTYRNCFPAYWAAPYINYYDGPVVVDGTRPTIVSVSTQVNGYPIESAQYKLTSSSRVPSIFLPIPEGYTIYIGAHGSVQTGNASVTVTPVINAGANGATTNLTLLNTSTLTRTNYSLSQTAGYIGVTVSMASTSTGTIQLDGLIAQVLPDGAVVASGGFISGGGTSGLSFISQPSVSGYSAVLDRIGVTAELGETEAWAWQ